MNLRNSNSQLNRLLRGAVIAVTALGFVMPASLIHGAEDGEYKPPGQFYTMELHLDWCGEAKTVPARIKRYEKFWELQSPKEEGGYDDGLHIRLVRRCAYRLTELYAQSGRTKDCLKMLKWLEKEDETAVEKEG